jgi:hypothetical protein
MYAKVGQFGNFGITFAYKSFVFGRFLPKSDAKIP